MKRNLRRTALVLALAALGYWAAAGANLGWTKNRVPKTSVDEVTGIEAIHYEDRFVPGVDFLGGAALGAGTLMAVSFLFRNKSK